MSELSVLPQPEDKLEIHTFGVGHGDCVLVELQQRGTPVFRMLCDAGKDSGNHIGQLSAYLTANRNSSGVDLDIVVLTHVDHDHQGGLHKLLDNNDISIGEYWGPCLPAFRRLKWLFSKRVQNSVDRAAELERLFKNKGVSVYYPMEGHTDRRASGNISLSVISPPARLLKRLMSGNHSDLEALLNSQPTSLEWLMVPSDQEREEDEFSFDLEQRTFSIPEDFPAEPFSEPSRPSEKTGLYEDEAKEPNFFGNRVLNDTSLVIAVDVWLDGKRRRRVLLTGDQENWSYIASRHPAGLGIDVLKAPHHGGMVYLADRKDDNLVEQDAGVVEQTYLWLRPRIAIVSAHGTYKLPHTRVRDALRATGAAVLCTNARGIERVSPPSAALNLNASCFSAYECGKNRQPDKTVLTLTSTTEQMDRPSCVSDTGARGAAPIVVLTQRLVEPDEAFLRWTKGELENHARWLRKLLIDYHRSFSEAVNKKGLINAMNCAPATWYRIETDAKESGRTHFLSSPNQALHYAKARGFIWTTETNFRGNPGGIDFYALPSPDEIDKAWKWVTRVPNFVFISQPSWPVVVGRDKLSILKSADTDSLCRIVAAKLEIPAQVAAIEVMPRLFLRMAKEFDFSICRSDYPERLPDPSWSSTYFLLLRNRAKPKTTSIPNIFDDEWESLRFSRLNLNDTHLDFILCAAESSAFVGPALFGHQSVQDTFSAFERPELEWVRSGEIARDFPERFENAAWLHLDDDTDID
ncbi:ComEC/Rec2 family competence protein [Variovorax sp. Root473]|uniref:ComEC/Rec2 family competence protein n=1 Tax=Variovorax sp. Root473 TaxID=1736541 RepID=UPI000A7E61F1|nr:MBL fold metallo-hydrolase [Variovorax sp. Root473]